jgi:hypothetical protein
MTHRIISRLPIIPCGGQRSRHDRAVVMGEQLVRLARKTSAPRCHTTDRSLNPRLSFDA